MVHFKVNWTGWLGYFLFALIGTTLYIYVFLPQAGGLATCLQIYPLYCASVYTVFHVPLGISGFFVVSHLVGHRNIKIFLFLLLALSGGLIVGLGGHALPVAHAQPVPVFFNVVDYRPVIYYVDPPQNITYTTTALGEFYVFEWLFFWPYHPVSFPSTCAPPVPTIDYEPVYVYVDLASQQVAAVAYRFHCQWTFISATDPGGVKTVVLPGVYSINATRPQITFLTRYHVPNNGAPGDPVRPWGSQGLTGLVDFQGTYTYTYNDSYNFTGVPALNANAATIDPAFYKNINWYNIEIITAVGFVVSAAFSVAFALERKKLAGPVVR